MLFRSNILALVGGGSAPKYPANKVMIWDDYQNKSIAELEFRTPVRAVRLRRDRIAVAIAGKTYVYNFSDLQLLRQIDTTANEKGLLVMSHAPENCVLAVPVSPPGSVKIEAYSLKESHVVRAHENDLACLALSHDGTLLATASEKGTLIRLFRTDTGEKVREFRRGADSSEIYSIAFDAQSRVLCSASDKGTVHIFSLDTNPKGKDTKSKGASTSDDSSDGSTKNKQSSLLFMKDMLPKYFSSEWSAAQFPLPSSARSLVAFGPEAGTIIVVTVEGIFEKWMFDRQSGECKQLEHASFVRE
jgi:WD40 repeat protein